MRIMLVAPPWLPVPPGSYGGTEAVVDELARGYAAAGHDVLLCTTGDSTCPVERRFVYERSQGILAGAAVELRHLVHAYEVAGDFDLVHDHTLLGPLYAAGGTEVQVVTTNHGPFDDELRAVYGAIGQRVPIIAISHAQAGTATPNIPIAAVIHHGIDAANFPFSARPGDYWLFLGRMNAMKGPHRAARVAREAGVRLVIAAKMREPEECRYFEEQVRPLLDDRVVYVGEVSGQEKLELFAGARGLLNPIRWPEPFGLVMIEALACGTPVLTFPSGAAPEIVRDGVTGFLCADEADMVRRLRDVDRLDRRACRVTVEESFSTERMVADHLALYETLMVREPAAA
jgi:glycosyltransferase involved in cell wall biosynthesis